MLAAGTMTGFEYTFRASQQDLPTLRANLSSNEMIAVYAALAYASAAVTGKLELALLQLALRVIGVDPRKALVLPEVRPVDRIDPI